MGLPEFKLQLDKHLDEFVDLTLERYRGIAREAMPIQAVEQGLRIVQAGGKRLRPYLAWLAFTLGGGTPSDHSVRFCLSLEVFHAFALCHDDIIDASDLRHGQVTTHEFIARRLAAEGRAGDLPRSGRSQAILVGDLLLNWSHELFAAGATINPDGFPAAQEEFFRMIEEVLIGEMLDVDLAAQTHASLEQIERKTLLKTARYSFSGPLTIGLLLSPNRTDQSVLERYQVLGESLGTAFQLQDDLLDILADYAQTGKPPASDVGQQTVLTHFVRTHAPTEMRRLFDRLMLAEELTNSEWAELTHIYHGSGAVRYCQELIGKQVAAARELADKDELLELVDLIGARI